MSTFRRGIMMASTRGYPVVWNQLVENGNFDDTTGWSPGRVENNVGISYRTTPGDLQIFTHVKKIAGHKYFVSCDINLSNPSVLYGLKCRLLWYGGAVEGPSLPTQPTEADKWYHNAFIYTALNSANSGEFNFYCYGSFSNGDEERLRRVTCFDLTLMFDAGNEPSTVAEFEAWLAENGLSGYQPYDAGTTRYLTKPSWIN